MAKTLPSITIIRDTREKKGWDFPLEDKVPGKIQVLGTESHVLDAADYAIKGAEDLIRIERKYGWAELFGNMTPKYMKERFEAEMEKMVNVKHKYLLIESFVSTDILSLGVPQMMRGLPCGTVMKWTLELQMTYGIVPIFCGDAGKKVARYLFEEAVRKYL